MLIHTDLSLLPSFKNAVVTVGTFDGVHTGHQQIIAQLKEEAEKIHGETVIITFHPHPRKVVRAGQSPVPVLTTLPEKIELLQSYGINHLVVIPFNEVFSHQTAEEYIEKFLFEKFHPKTVIIGYDHRFGKGRQGDYRLMEDYGQKLGFDVKEIPEHILNKVTISSTKVREALLSSDIETANIFLGHDYFFEGVVIEGNKLGRTLGYPTANLQIENSEKLVPGNGIYAVGVTVGVFEGFGMMNIGIRPTVNGTKRVIEVNIFDFDQDIYAQTLRVYVKHYLRGERKFSGLDALKTQLAKDKEDALKKLNVR